MLALIAGTGALPSEIISHAASRPLVCALDGIAPEETPDIVFRLEHLGSFLGQLKSLGVTQIAMAGGVTRPAIDPSQIDDATKPLVPIILGAIASGDDGALRAVMAIFEAQGFEVIAAHQLLPHLVAQVGVMTQTRPTPFDAQAAFQTLHDMGQADVGQSCILSGATVLAKETQDGTDAMIGRFEASDHRSNAILFKGPKPNQDLRADLPVIGPDTAKAVVSAGLSGIVVVAGGVMILARDEVCDILDQAGAFLCAIAPAGERP